MTEELEQLLRNLKLYRLQAVYDEQLRAADKQQITYTDFVAVARAYADDVRSAGGEIVFGAEVTGLKGARVRSTAGEFGFDRVVVCAGLQSDRVSRLAGDTPGPAIVLRGV